jgi:hypothetical protein
VACIIATNASPPDSSRISAHQSLRVARTPSPEDLFIGGFSISIRGEPLVVQIAARLISAHEFDSNSRSRSNSGSDGIFSSDTEELSKTTTPRPSGAETGEF